MVERYNHNEPQILEPVYCPEEGLWFTDDGTTAKSLSELQQKLPGAVLEGYYPEGFSFRQSPLKPGEVTRSPFRASQFAYSLKTEHPRVRAPRVIEPEPAPMVPVLEETKAEFKPVEQLKPKQQRKSHKRAAWWECYPSNEKSIFPKVDWSIWDAAVKDMIEIGMSFGQVADRVGCSRSAIAGRVHRKGFKKQC